MDGDELFQPLLQRSEWQAVHWSVPSGARACPWAFCPAWTHSTPLPPLVLARMTGKTGSVLHLLLSFHVVLFPGDEEFLGLRARRLDLTQLHLELHVLLCGELEVLGKLRPLGFNLGQYSPVLTRARGGGPEVLPPRLNSGPEGLALLYECHGLLRKVEAFCDLGEDLGREGRLGPRQRVRGGLGPRRGCVRGSFHGGIACCWG
mmetsp:Transcript_4449/g.13277  ORF Transcript_4449/g.13277 Transcript_4449/m.13277 type:complete len:204 (+) Transcript_4449:632-1243(+)